MTRRRARISRLFPRPARIFLPKGAEARHRQRTGGLRGQECDGADDCELQIQPAWKRDAGSGPAYILNVEPLQPSKFLYRGKIWVDAADFAVVKMETLPAKSPSCPDFARGDSLNVKTDGFWLPEKLRQTGRKSDGEAFQCITGTCRYYDREFLLPGVSAKLDKRRLEQGETASLTIVAADSASGAVTVFIDVSPLGTQVPIKVNIR